MFVCVIKMIVIYYVLNKILYLSLSFIHVKVSKVGTDCCVFQSLC